MLAIYFCYAVLCLGIGVVVLILGAYRFDEQDIQDTLAYSMIIGGVAIMAASVIACMIPLIRGDLERERERARINTIDEVYHLVLM